MMCALDIHGLIWTTSVVCGQAYRSFGRFLSMRLIFQESNTEDKESAINIERMFWSIYRRL